MKYMKRILVLFLFTLLVFDIHAQDRVIQGIVTTLGNVPLENVQIKVKSTNQIVRTDIIGQFAVSCNFNDKLIVSARGFKQRRIKIKKPIKFAAINLTFRPVHSGRAYAIGYDHVLEDMKINAVGNVNENDANFSVYNNIYELIKGRIPGVQVEAGKIVIRGENSINASSDPTIIVDGSTVSQGYLQSIRPSDVKNISVIKDGSAAIYGFKGSNGVIIIETKMAQRQNQ